MVIKYHSYKHTSNLQFGNKRKHDCADAIYLMRQHGSNSYMATQDV